MFLSYAKWTQIASLYLALSTNALEEAVKTDKVTEFYTAYAKWFPRLACEDHRIDFINSLGATL